MSKENKKELTDLQKSFLSVLFESPDDGGAGGNIRLAMNLAGYSKHTSIQEVTKPLAEEISKLSLEYIAAGSGEAVAAVFDILRAPNSLGAGNKLKAAQMILDRAGITKKAEDVSVSVPQGGLIILPAKQPRDTEVREEDIIRPDGQTGLIREKK